VCGYVRCREDDGFGVYIYDLLVRKTHRGKQIGKTLMEWVFKDFPNQTIYVMSDVDPYYEKLGYRREGSIFKIKANYVEQQAPEQEIGIWGASYGGATAGPALAYEDMDEKVHFLILDCPVSSMEWMVEQEMETMEIGIPVSYMTWCGNIVNKLKLGFTYHIYDALPESNREIWTVEDSEHLRYGWTTIRSIAIKLKAF
jgi:hypothetical protein